MSASPISPKVINLLEKISQLTIDEVHEVENYIEFLLTKKEDISDHFEMMTDNTSHADTISEFIASFASPSALAPSEQNIPPLPFSTYSSEKTEAQSKPDSRIEQIRDEESSQVIIAPEEPSSEEYPNEIDFADINTRFAKKREEQQGKEKKESHFEHLDWL